MRLAITIGILVASMLSASVVGQNVVPNGNSYAGPYGYGEYATYDADGYLTSYRLGFDVIGNDGIPEIVVLTTTTWDCP